MKRQKSSDDFKRPFIGYFFPAFVFTCIFTNEKQHGIYAPYKKYKLN